MSHNRRVIFRQVNAHVRTGHELLKGGIHVADDFHATEENGVRLQLADKRVGFELAALSRSWFVIRRFLARDDWRQISPA